ncbi:MAG: hypothetical protein J6A75_13400 [Lachnospiraceae bacterium]|nr:hypothetical protein [Lachnospiraceae bacterium]
MYIIKKSCDGEEYEYLPEEYDTKIWEDLEEKETKNRRYLFNLYVAVKERENYYANHTATAFGNPELSFLKGKVFGLLVAEDIVEEETDDYIIFLKNNRRILVIEKISKEYFRQSQRDVNKTLAELGF